MKRSPWEWGMIANLSLTEQFDTQQISKYMPLTPKPHWLRMDLFHRLLKQHECSPQLIYVERLRDNFGWRCGHVWQPKSLKFYKYLGIQMHIDRSDASRKQTDTWLVWQTCCSNGSLFKFPTTAKQSMLSQRPQKWIQLSTMMSLCSGEIREAHGAPCSTSQQQEPPNHEPFPSLDKEAASQGSNVHWGTC